jgi:hypothetical protein
MKHDTNKIIRYFDNQMPDAEKELFEIEINNSPGLQKEIEEYKLFISTFKEIELKEGYFNNIVPKFREKLDKESKPKSLSVRFALAGSSIAAVIIAVLLFSNSPNNTNIENIEQLASQMTTEDINAAANTYLNNINLSDLNINSSEVYDSIFTKILDNELNVSSNSNLNLISSNNTSLSQLEQYISNEEADNIYNEILNKQFFKE